MQTQASTGRRGKIPAYIQVASALRRRIEIGDWQPSQQIATLEELELEFQVARVTVRQAVEMLEREGLVSRQQGRGTFVSDKVKDKRWLSLATSWQSLLTSIRVNVPKFIEVAHPPPFPRLRAGEGALAEEYVFLRSVQSKDGVPYAVASVHIEKSIFERGRERFLKHTALPVLADMKPNIQHAHQTFVIGTADRETAHLLQVTLGAPIAEVGWVVRNDADVVIYASEIAYRSDSVKISIDFSDQARATTRRRRPA